MTQPESFRTIYTIMNLWKNVGWNSIIFLAAISGINGELYEACRVDGGGYLRQMWHITLPGIASTIVVLLILRLGSIMGVGYEKIILMYFGIVFYFLIKILYNDLGTFYIRKE